MCVGAGGGCTGVVSEDRAQKEVRDKREQRQEAERPGLDGRSWQRSESCGPETFPGPSLAPTPHSALGTVSVCHPHCLDSPGWQRVTPGEGLQTDAARTRW